MKKVFIVLSFCCLFLTPTSGVEINRENFSLTMRQLGYVKYGDISLIEYLSLSNKDLKAKYGLKLSLKDRINHNIHRIAAKASFKKLNKHLLAKKAAGDEGDDTTLWFLMGLIIGPVAVLIALIVKSVSKRERNAAALGCLASVVLVLLVYLLAFVLLAAV